MTLTWCSDVSPARWIADAEVPWDRLVSFGPDGFPAHARLRFLPDPAYPGQSENDVEEPDGALPEGEQLRIALEVLAAHTRTPSDCFFCVWEGFADDTAAVADDTPIIDDPAEIARLELAGFEPAVHPDGSESPPPFPKVVVPHRAYWLFRGSWADLGFWDAARGWPDRVRLHGTEPAFVWPADHAWCLADDVDPHWAGVAGSRQAIDALLADGRLDVVEADPLRPQPAYS